MAAAGSFLGKIFTLVPDTRRLPAVLKEFFYSPIAFSPLRLVEDEASEGGFCF